MNKQIRALMVEDSGDDADLVLRELKKGGFEVSSARVETASGFQTALENNDWDVIICDYVLPRFGAPQALEMFSRQGRDIPFIVVSGKASEQTVSECMKAGACDYVLKDRLKRLTPAVEREIAEARVRREYRITEEARKLSERRFRSLCENMLEGYAYCRMIYEEGAPADFEYLEINEAFSKLTGLGDVAGKRVSAVIPGLKETSPELFDTYARVAGTGKTERFEFRIPQLNVWLDISVYSPQRGDFIAVFDNITERKTAEEKVTRLNRILLALRNVNQLITREHDRHKLLGSACRNLVETRGFEKCWIAAVDDDGRVTGTAEAGFGKVFTLMEEQLRTQGLPPCATEAKRLGKALIIDEPLRALACRKCPIHPGEHPSNSLMAPMTVEGKFIGVIGVDVPAHIELDAGELGLFQELADDVGFALNNMELEELKNKAEQDLASSERKYRTLVDNVPSGVLIVADGRIVFANDVVEKLSGYTPADLRAIDPFSIIHEDDRQTVRDYAALRAEGRAAPERYDVRVYRKDGSVLWLDRRVVLVDWMGRPASLFLDSDNTARKEAEEALEKSENRFRSIFSTANVGIAVSANRVLQEVNDELCIILGYTRDEMVGREARFLYPTQEEYDGIGALHEHLVRRSEAVVETRLIRKDGSVIEAALGMVALEPWHPENGVTITIRDITQRKKAEAELLTERDKAKQLLDVAGVLIMTLDTQGKITLMNAKGCEILGYQADEILGKNWVDNFLPEGIRTGKKEGFNKLILGELEPVEYLENPVLTRGGEQRIIAWHNSLILNDAGEITGTLSSGEDITARKRADKALAEEIARRSRLFEQTPVGIVIIDPATTGILEYNSLAHRQLGYTREELGKLTIADIDCVETQNEIKDHIAAVLHEGLKEFETLHRTKQGEIRNVYVIAQGVDAAGRTVYQCIWQDITERKAAEEKIKASEQKIQESYGKLEQTLAGTIEAISRISEMKDPYTAGHQRRVARLACAIAAEMGLSDEIASGLRVAGLLHDMGKMQIPSEILTKPGKLSAIEMQLIQGHASDGCMILESVEFPWPVAEIVSQHHERIDGSGYPLGLTGEGILLEAKILGVADAVEAMASHRPYRPALGVPLAIKEIQANSGNLFDADVVAACLKLFEKGYEITDE